VTEPRTARAARGSTEKVSFAKKLIIKRLQILDCTMKTQYFKFVVPIACLVLLTTTTLARESTSSSGSRPPAVSESSRGDYNHLDEDVPDFRLLGIAVSNSPGQSLAVIETGPDRRQRFIREGDRVGEMTVKKILSDRVVFDTGRGERIARLNSAFLDSVSDGATPVFRQPVSVRLPPTDNTKIVEVESEKLAASLGDVNDAARQVNINPIVVYGEPIGIRISPIAPGGVFEELGLETGDIITAVNGREISKQEEAIAFLELIQSSGDFDISVRGSRRNKEIQLIVK
jgi:type II secretion system protein C